jgi:hypothetical protein
MREITTYLLKTLHPLLSYKIKEDQGFVSIESFVLRIYDLLQKGQKISETIRPKTIPLHWVTNETMTTGPNFHFVDEAIRERITVLSKVETTYSFSLHGHSVAITFLFPFSEQDDTHVSLQTMQTYFDTCFHSLFLWLTVAFPLSHKDCSRELNYYIYMTDAVKLIPHHGAIMDKIHVNTGATNSCLLNNSIYVYRWEEWLKVSIHETFHSLGMDFSEHAFPEDNLTNCLFESNIKRLFPIQEDISILVYETYTEWLAETMHVCIFSFFKLWRKSRNDLKHSSLTPNHFFRMFMKHWERERTFSCLQFAKIMVHQGLSWTDCIEGSQKISRYQENTNVFAYYILKTILLFHYEASFQWLMEENKGSLQFDKTKTKAHAESFCMLFKKHYSSPAFVKTILHMEEWCKKTRQDVTLERKTLRMTLFE